MIKKTFSAVCALFLIWCAVSFVDIASDNNTTADHSNLNIVYVLGGARQ